MPRCASKARKRERGLWQRRFWEHGVRDEEELVAVLEYCRLNPVKHGLVAEPEAWPSSSFGRRQDGQYCPSYLSAALPGALSVP